MEKNTVSGMRFVLEAKSDIVFCLLNRKLIWFFMVYFLRIERNLKIALVNCFRHF